MPSGFVTTSDGVRLYAESAGEGPSILFIAGYTATLATWAFQVDAVLAAGYRAVCLDRRWHGRSERPAYGHRIARHAADVREVVAALDLERPLLVGASMGASVCWSFIDLFGPQALAGMAGIDQTPRMVNGADWSHGFYGLTEANLGSFFADGVPSTRRDFSSEHTEAELARLQARVGDQALFQDVVAETRPLLDDHARQDWRDVIAATTVPVLMLAGRESQLWPCEHADAAVAPNPSGRSVIIGNAGHATNIDQAAAVNGQLIGFASEIFGQT